ncbi:tRNA glutamyl-Q(34) synthetase GluQRS [Halomonas litopenaei]|uniref:Glutamyl-Q tRNA(Asp) synthetase n=1 Tax=Halomonas litopenaei TaxID=2109328 RepID=A0ABX5IZ82_9GAMM|nr:MULTISPECIES: tRNA glutamyl-Q(34) synthetase GluQRS [Halomonas]PTL91117.1 tRNA glutamyl-Q(34) synthetase GluQRS [Halomonas sp. SYSU XM8]PTL95409.1 tRNA glutamyl-Q(34) synthetase GluQRS [Halomonas litopenaei]
MHHVHGRFAPTPSGPLHAGSLVAAVASYLDARSQQGRWSLRIEDVDPPRCPPGSVDTILRQLETFGLAWDGEVRYQSHRHDAYARALARLTEQGMAYTCSCSRKQWRDYGIYPGWCRDGVCQPEAPQAWRLRSDLGQRPVIWHDRLQGLQRFDPAALGDVVLKRKDGLWAYQLAVVVDDIDQNITDVVRGADLLDNTPWQLQLLEALGAEPPRYLHLPLVIGQDGQKLSKQNLARPLPEDPRDVRRLLHATLALLGQSPDPAASEAPVAEQLEAACRRWRPRQIPRADIASQGLQVDGDDADTNE